MPHSPLSPRYLVLVRLCAWGAFVWEKIFLDSDLNVKQKRKTLYSSVGGAYFRIYGSVALLEGHISESPLVCQHQPWSVTDSPLSNRSPYIVVIVKRMLSAMKLKARVTYIAVPLFSEAKSAFTFSCVTIYDPSVHFVPLSIIHLNPIQPLPSTRQPWITKTISLKNYKW